MNLLKVQSCVQLENQRLVLANKIKKTTPEQDEHKKLQLEIIKLTSQIDSIHAEIEEKK